MGIVLTKNGERVVELDGLLNMLLAFCNPQVYFLCVALKIIDI
jgi:hypothetical protein